jgi:N-acetyl-gamma-glutamyl-phosphate/LysW-gamma-L-alpha-aminoadipyl-6-phosphate reductase
VVTSRQHVGEYVHRAHPSLKGFIDITFSAMDLDKIADSCDLVFVSVPHGNANKIVKNLYERDIKIIDLSADFSKNLKDYVNGMVNILFQLYFQNQYMECLNFIVKRLKKPN